MNSFDVIWNEINFKFNISRHYDSMSEGIKESKTADDGQTGHVYTHIYSQVSSHVFTHIFVKKDLKWIFISYCIYKALCVFMSWAFSEGI